jgi:hypothetical protein
MFRRGIWLLLLAAAFVLSSGLLSNAVSDLTYIPASQDVYIGMGVNNVTVFNQTDVLVCAVNVSQGNGTEQVNYPGCPVIQFNISGYNISDDDAVVMLLKAQSILKGSDPVMVALMSISSDWNEGSDFTTFLVNILPAWNIIKGKDATAMSSSTDGDSVFAFDVSKKIKDAKAKGNNISFLLEAISNSSAEISFGSRESEMGPYLVIMPYPNIMPHSDITPCPEAPPTETSAQNSTLAAGQIFDILEIGAQ